ncbi:sugar ABC transporter permease [Actinoallomurus sp. NPDC050550]|uniref:carbohydrate ABC transporter permease n=1 Tax=Actinoallomurus sp. NPDC050550 TaxID=3154937 RepID=UPI0033E6B77C
MAIEADRRRPATTPKAARGEAPRAPRLGRRARGSRTGATKGLLFTVPYILGFLGVYVIPVGYTIVRGLYRQQRSGLGFGPARSVFVGLGNFLKVFHDGLFWTGLLRVTLFGAVAVPVMLGLALLLALLLDGITARAVRLFRVGYLVPYVVPSVVAALIWLYLYSPEVSPINSTARHAGVTIDFFGPVTTYLTLGNVLVWEQIGFNMILIYSALQAIPRELYEAARIDGASERRIAWSIKIPNLRPVLIFTGMFSIINALQLLTEPFVLRLVGWKSISKDFTPMQMIYNAASAESNYEYAAAMSTVLAVVTGILAFVFYRLTNRKVTA